MIVPVLMCSGHLQPAFLSHRGCWRIIFIIGTNLKGSVGVGVGERHNFTAFFFFHSYVSLCPEFKANDSTAFSCSSIPNTFKINKQIGKLIHNILKQMIFKQVYTAPKLLFHSIMIFGRLRNCTFCYWQTIKKEQIQYNLGKINISSW